MAKYRFEDIAINSTQKKKPTEEDKYTYLGLEHLDSGTLKVSRFGSEVAPIGEKLIMKKGDVLFGKRRAYQKKVAIAPFDGIFSAHGMVLRPKTEVIDPDFFPLFISSDYFLDAAIKISVGSLSPTINWKDLRELEFELPSLEKQKELAKLLWSMQDTIESYRDVLNKSDDMLEAEFIKMFGDNHFESSKWELKPLGKVCEVLNGYAFKSNLYVDSGIRVIRITNVQKGVVDDSDPQFYPLSFEKELSKYMLKEDDIVLSLTGNVGRCGLITENLLPAALNQRVACIRIKDKSLDNKFLFSFMNSNIFLNDCIESSQGIAQKNMSTEWLKDYKVIVPPKDMQQKFIRIANTLNDSKKNLSKSLNELVHTYKSIIENNLCERED